MGRWEDIESPWYETQIVNCSFCGRMIPKRMWIGDTADGERVFCSEKCETLAGRKATGSATASASRG